MRNEEENKINKHAASFDAYRHIIYQYSLSQKMNSGAAEMAQ